MFTDLKDTVLCGESFGRGNVIFTHSVHGVKREVETEGHSCCGHTPAIDACEFMMGSYQVSQDSKDVLQTYRDTIFRKGETIGPEDWFVYVTEEAEEGDDEITGEVAKDHASNYLQIECGAVLDAFGRFQDLQQRQSMAGADETQKFDCELPGPQWRDL
jgi:hypothetical protein